VITQSLPAPAEPPTAGFARRLPPKGGDLRWFNPKPATALALASLLSACAVGPDFHRPAKPDAQGYTAQPLPSATTSAKVAGGGAQTLSPGADIPGMWWELFHSEKLDALMKEAIARNPDLESARAALRQADQLYKAERGALMPTVDAGFQSTRAKNSNALSPVLSTPNQLYSLHTATLTVGYVPDVFGGVRRQVENARAQAESQRFQLEAAYLTLTSNLAAAAIQQASLRAQVASIEKAVAADRELLQIYQAQFKAGQISGADVAAQEALVAQTEALLPPLRKQLAQQNDLIAVLTGHLPGEGIRADFDLDELVLPDDLPLSLPSRLVDQRPDIRAAEANLHAASASVGVAVAARLPNITLTGTAGGASPDITQLFTGGNNFWSLSGELAQPIFQGGALWHKQKAAEAAFDQARAQYRSAVLTGFQNVADSLEAVRHDAEGLKAALLAEAATRKSLDITRAQLRVGQVSSASVLTAEMAHQQAVQALVQARAARYADTVALFQSLGGGWWNRKDK
jgi:NodT family efflux transporter outer membrane factor (OMF) lipoprotein